MIGLVLGDTQIGVLIIKKLKSLKINYTIIDISKKKIFKKEKNSHAISIGQLGKTIKILKKNKCKNIIFAGRVTRPSFVSTKFDLKALYYLPKIIKGSKKGDAYIIKEIIKIFNKEKLKVISQIYFNPELSLKNGTYTKQKVDSLSKKNIIIGKRIISDLKDNNVGQAVVVSNNRIIAVEDKNGTDFMLTRAEKILKSLNKKNKREGILLKFPKTNQDLRIDLPTVGIKTVVKCAKIGLRGIVLRSKKNIFLDKNKIIKYANKNKMFITVQWKKFLF